MLTKKIWNTIYTHSRDQPQEKVEKIKTAYTEWEKGRELASNEKRKPKANSIKELWTRLETHNACENTNFFGGETR